MQPDSKTGRLERRQPLRQQCTSHTRQHIAEPRAGHSWMPAITQCKPAVAVGDKGSGALEQYGTTEARSKSARGGWSIGLHLGHGDVQQSCGLTGMRCE